MSQNTVQSKNERINDFIQLIKNLISKRNGDAEFIISNKEVLDGKKDVFDPDNEMSEYLIKIREVQIQHTHLIKYLSASLEDISKNYNSKESKLHLIYKDLKNEINELDSVYKEYSDRISKISTHFTRGFELCHWYSKNDFVLGAPKSKERNEFILMRNHVVADNDRSESSLRNDQNASEDDMVYKSKNRKYRLDETKCYDNGKNELTERSSIKDEYFIIKTSFYELIDGEGEKSSIANTLLKRFSILTDLHHFTSPEFIYFFEEIIGTSSKYREVTLLSNNNNFRQNYIKFQLSKTKTQTRKQVSDFYRNSYSLLISVLEKHLGDFDDELEVLVYDYLMNHMIPDYVENWLENRVGNLDTLFNTDSVEQILFNFCALNLADFRAFDALAFIITNRNLVESKNYLSSYYEITHRYDAIKEHLLINDYEASLLSKNANRVLNIDDIDLMSGYEFELAVAKLFEKMSYHVEITRGSGDQGIDVIAKKNQYGIGIQAKNYTGRVNNKAVQEVVAGLKHYGLKKGIVVSNNYFTKSAVDLAVSNNVILWDRDIIIAKLKQYNLQV